LCKIIEHKNRLICAKVSSNDHKYGILSETWSLKRSEIFINEDCIPKDQTELRKEVQKIKEPREEEKWVIIINR
jgi:hypothetical protein